MKKRLLLIGFVAVAFLTTIVLWVQARSDVSLVQGMSCYGANYITDPRGGISLLRKYSSHAAFDETVARARKEMPTWVEDVKYALATFTSPDKRTKVTILRGRVIDGFPEQLGGRSSVVSKKFEQLRKAGLPDAHGWVMVETVRVCNQVQTFTRTLFRQGANRNMGVKPYLLIIPEPVGGDFNQTIKPGESTANLETQRVTYIQVVAGQP